MIEGWSVWPVLGVEAGEAVGWVGAGAVEAERAEWVGGDGGGG